MLRTLVMPQRYVAETLQPHGVAGAVCGIDGAAGMELFASDNKIYRYW